MIKFIKQRRNIFGIVNIALALYFIVISILYFISRDSRVNGIFLIYIGLVFLALGIGSILSKFFEIIYVISYLTIVLIMSLISIWLIDITEYNAMIIGIVACVIGVGLMLINEYAIDKVVTYFSKKKDQL